ncbi:adenine nucleotide alpha hydrolases-like superfamily protein [Wolffia australiana]
MNGAMGESLLRQLSRKEARGYGGGRGSRRWSRGGYGDQSLKKLQHDVAGLAMKKRVVVVIDQSTRAKHAMMWALTHVANKGDVLTLIHVVSPHSYPHRDSARSPPRLADSLGALCKACKPEVEVEALVIQGPKLATVLSQVKKLEASVLVLGQSKPSAFCCLFPDTQEEFVENCINRASCLTLAVRKQSGGLGGYLVSTRWQKNFWLLA